MRESGRDSTYVPTHGGSESGTALIFAIVLTVSVSALVMAHIGEVNSEQRKVRSVFSRQRATERAVGELERARNVVNAAPYLHGKNTAIWAALHSDPPYIPGTEVAVEDVGDPNSDWYVLRATGAYQQVTKSAQIFVRQRSPVTAFNLFVADHPVGVSGTPLGVIHANKKLEFMFPYGTYRDSVSASQGYEFKADATPDNTRIWGPSNPNAAPMNNVLSAIQFSDLSARAGTLRVTDDLLAQVTFEGKNTKIDLFSTESRTLVPRVGTRRIFSGFQTVTRKRKVRDYVDVPYKIKVPTYREVTEHITKIKPVYKWTKKTVTKQKPIYRQIKEHYYEKEEIWGTKMVARATYESDFVTTNSGVSAIQQLKELLDRVDEIHAMTDVVAGLESPDDADDDAGDDAGDDGGDDGGVSYHGVYRVTYPALYWERQKVKGAKRKLEAEPVDYTRAEDRLDKLLRNRGTNVWLPTLKADQAAIVDSWYTAVAAAKTAIATEKATGAKTDYGDLSHVDIAKLAEMWASGSQHGDAGHYELRASHDYVEIPYVVSTKLVRKTRLKRVKRGTRLVTMTKKVRTFSHNKTKHILRKRRVLTGDAWVVRSRRVPKGWKVITESVEVPLYTDTPYTYYEEVIVPKTLVRTENVSSNGLIYIEKEIERLGGDLNGRLTLSTNSAIQVTNNVRYVDDAGNTRMLHGDDASEAYVQNPDYSGNAALLLISRDDIVYSKDVPSRFEINATMVSVTGKIAMEGLEVSSDGSEISVGPDVTANPSSYVKDSIRRLGGLIAAKRPVAAFVDSTNTVVAGFREGTSQMDTNLVPERGGVNMPPHTPQVDRPSWTLLTIGRRLDVTR